jgi:hypothetical protein
LEKNVKIAFKEVDWERVDWIGLALDRDRQSTLVNRVTGLRVA